MKALDFLAKHFDLLGEEREKLYNEKLKAETEFAQMRAAKLLEDKKDTSLLDAIVEGRKRFEQMKRGESEVET